MNRLAEARVRALAGEGLSGFVLKSKSPSCGMARVKVFADVEARAPAHARGVGLFAAALSRAFPTLPIEEEGRLEDPGLRENFVERIFAYARLRALWSGRWTLGAVYDLFPKLRELRNRQGGFLSGGEQQMLTIARTLMGNPELLLLDEPSEGLAPLVVEALLDNIRALKTEGLTILLAEQGVDFSLELADRVYILEKGTIRHSGPASELREDTALRDRLLAL